MSRRAPFRAAAFFCGLIYRCQEDVAAAQAVLAEIGGASELVSEPIPFIASDYYRREMGAPLWRRFVAFATRRSPEELPAFKLAAMALEERLAVGGCRRVNIDPGYLSEANVVIATAKNFAHRVPLRDGIYAHLEYVVKDGQLQPLPWTYPDFRSQAYLDFFASLRRSLRRGTDAAGLSRTTG